jgi:penicillin amidase
MRFLLRWALRGLAGLVALILLAAAGIAGALWWSLPATAPGTIPGLASSVAIEIDEDAIPRIRAASLEDAAAALGWLHARDRMFQMDMMRRAAAGELSEIAGTPTLPLDRMMRTLGLRRAAEADAASLDPETRAMLEAYARGVNAYIAARGRFAAAEFIPLGAPRPWTPTDSLLWAKTMGLYLSGNWRTELARAANPNAAPWPPTHGTAAPHAAALPTFPDPFTLPASASNAWAVDGQHSATGAPLLAGDPHLGFAMPGTWYLAYIETPTLSLAGATAPGVPMLVMGHNHRIAWSFTTTGADVQDLFVETPAGPNMYATPDGPRPFMLREERIRIRGAPDEILTVRETRHGPVVSDLVAPNGPILAAAMANLATPDTAAAGLMALNRAQSVEQAGAAAARISSPVQNLMVADRDRIAYFLTGRIPIRRAGDGSHPAPGADGNHDWTGWASGRDLPHGIAPTSGRLVNANERIAPPDFPVFLGRDWHDDLRARRARALLEARPKHTVADFAAMQTDTLSLFAADVLPRLLALDLPEGPARTARDLLQGWDGTMDPARPQPLIFNAWMQAFAAALKPGDGAAPWWHLAHHALTRPDAARPDSAWCGGDCTALLRQSLDEAIPALVARYGANPASWRWGTAHQAVFAHPLLRFIAPIEPFVVARVPVGGDATTLLRANWGGRGFDAVHGAAFRGVYDLADLSRSRFAVAPGQSGHILLPSARNFLARWQRGETIPLTSQPATPATRFTLLPEASR